MADKTDKKFVSDDEYSAVEHPVDAVGGDAVQSHTGADLKKEVDPEAEKVVQKKNGHIVKESFGDLFEGMELSEDFKEKAALVFEAAVNEATKSKVEETVSALEEKFETELSTALEESLDDIVENLDSYLDYVVKEWMSENEIAIESGIKVEMAESLMSGLKELFYEHNVAVDEETIDLVAELEEELGSMKNTAKKAINETLSLQEEVAALKAELVFNESCEGLTVSETERFRTLSENLDISDLDEFTENLSTLKESFFSKKAVALSEDLDQEGDYILEEITTPTRVSQFEDISAIASAMISLK